MPIGGVRDFSGAFVASLNFGAAKDMSGVPHRNVLKAGRSSSRYSARNDAISGYIVTTSIHLLSFTFRENKLENVIEYGSKRKSTLKKPNAPKVESQE